MKLDPAQQRGLEEVAEQHRLDLVLLFGSAVTQKLHPRSDLDIAVHFREERDITHREYAELVHALSEIFPDRQVDLGVVNHADPLFLKKITEHCQLLVGSTQRLQQLAIYAFKRYQDHRPYFEMEERFVRRALAGAAP